MAKTMPTAFHHIRRNPYQAIAAVLILSLTFFAVSVFILISIGFHLVLRHFEAAPQVIAFFEKGQDLEEEDITRIRTSLEKTGKLDSFSYVSTKQAEQIYKEKNKNDPLLNELVDYKILPPSIEISAQEIEALPELKEILEQEPLVKDMAFYEDIVQRLTLWLTNIRMLGVGMIAFLLALSVLILMIIIGFKVKNKRGEIEILRLLGASGWYVHGPFLMEGMIYGGLGAFFGWLGAFTLLQYATPFLLGWLEDTIQLPVPLEILGMLCGIMVMSGMFVGGFGSLLAVRRFIKI